jgi:hypothetical protein
MNAILSQMSKGTLMGGAIYVFNYTFPRNDRTTPYAIKDRCFRYLGTLFPQWTRSVTRDNFFNIRYQDTNYLIIPSGINEGVIYGGIFEEDSSSGVYNFKPLIQFEFGRI